MSSFARTEFYLLQNGRLSIDSRSAGLENARRDEQPRDSQLTQPVAPTELASSSNLAREQSPFGDEYDVDACTPSDKAKSFEAHRVYFRSFGSPIIVAVAGILILTWVGLDRAASEYFWKFCQSIAFIWHEADLNSFLAVALGKPIFESGP